MATQWSPQPEVEVEDNDTNQVLLENVVPEAAEPTEKGSHEVLVQSEIDAIHHESPAGMPFEELIIAEQSFTPQTHTNVDPLMIIVDGQPQFCSHMASNDEQNMYPEHGATTQTIYFSPEGNSFNGNVFDMSRTTFHLYIFKDFDGETHPVTYGSNNESSASRCLSQNLLFISPIEPPQMSGDTQNVLEIIPNAVAVKQEEHVQLNWSQSSDCEIIEASPEMPIVVQDSQTTQDMLNDMNQTPVDYADPMAACPEPAWPNSNSTFSASPISIATEGIYINIYFTEIKTKTNN